MSTTTLEMVNYLIGQYNDPRTDGYVKAGLRNELIEIQNKINNALRPVNFDDDFDIESLDPSERTWYYDGNGKKRLREI